MAISAAKPSDHDHEGHSHTPPSGGFTYEVKDLPESRKELEVKVTPERFQASIDHVYYHLSQDVQISGFRAGKAPRNLVEAKLGARLYEEAINEVIPQVTAQIMVETKLNPLDYAQYSVKKVSRDEGLEFTAAFTVMPEVKLPDLSKLGVKKEEVKVDKKEVEEAFDRLKESLQQPEKGESAEEGKEEKKAAKKAEAKEIDWAKELNDEALKTEADVRQRLEDIIKQRKESEVEEKLVDELVRAAIKKAGIQPPQGLIDAEARVMEQQYTQRIERLGIKLEDFLKTQNTDMETLRKNWKTDAEFKIAADLLFVAVAREHNLKVEIAEIDDEIAKVSDEKVKEQYSTDEGKNYISSVMLRQKAVDKLRELAGVKREEPKVDAEKK